MSFITQVRNMWDIDQGENAVIWDPAITSWNSYIKMDPKRLETDTFFFKV